MPAPLEAVRAAERTAAALRRPPRSPPAGSRRIDESDRRRGESRGETESRGESRGGSRGRGRGEPKEPVPGLLDGEPMLGVLELVRGVNDPRGNTGQRLQQGQGEGEGEGEVTAWGAPEEQAVQAL